jgi:hypothetical protein
MCNIILHTNTSFYSVLRIRICFNADPGPAFYLNADPGPAFYLNADPDPAFYLNTDPDRAFESQKVKFLHEKYT